MRHFTIQIGNETRGPLTEDEIVAMISAGWVTPDTLCAQGDSAEWTPLSQHFGFGSNLKLKWAKPEASEAEQEATASRLDHDTRLRLLKYGLADAVSVDAFTQVQALLALEAHEKALRAETRRHRLISLASLTACVGCGMVLGLAGGVVGDALAFCVNPFVGEETNAKTSLLVLRSELRQFAEIKSRADRAVFGRPAGGTPALNLIASRLQIDPTTAFTFRGTADTSPLSRQIAGWGIRLEDDRRVYVLREPPSERARLLLKAQSDILEEILSPPLDEAGFAQMFAETMAGFPGAAFPEAGRLRSEAGGVRLSSLRIFIDRVDFRAQAAASQAAQKQWAAELVVFSEKLKALQAKAHALTSPDARRRRWSEFNAGPGAELAAWMLTAGAKEGRLGADGSFRVAGVGAINATSLGRVIVSARIHGDPVFLPWGCRHLGAGSWHSETLPSAQLIANERYLVVDKVAVGGRDLHARLRTPTHEFVVTRPSPRWRYLALARSGDKEPVFALVDEKTFASARKGTPVAAAELAPFELFLSPAESVRPDGLYED